VDEEVSDAESEDSEAAQERRDLEAMMATETLSGSIKELQRVASMRVQAMKASFRLGRLKRHETDKTDASGATTTDDEDGSPSAAKSKKASRRKRFESEGGETQTSAEESVVTGTPARHRSESGASDFVTPQKRKPRMRSRLSSAESGDGSAFGSGKPRRTRNESATTGDGSEGDGADGSEAESADSAAETASPVKHPRARILSAETDASAVSSGDGSPTAKGRRERVLSAESAASSMASTVDDGQSGSEGPRRRRSRLKSTGSAHSDGSGSAFSVVTPSNKKKKKPKTLKLKGTPNLKHLGSGEVDDASAMGSDDGGSAAEGSGSATDDGSDGGGSVSSVTSAARKLRKSMSSSIKKKKKKLAARISTARSRSRGSSVDGSVTSGESERGEGRLDHTMAGVIYHKLARATTCLVETFCQRDLRILQLRQRYHRTFVCLELSLKEVNRLYKAYTHLGILTAEGRLPASSVMAECDIDKSRFFTRLLKLIVYTRANSCNTKFLDFRSFVILSWAVCTLSRDDLVGFLYAMYATCFMAKSPRERRERLPKSVTEWDFTNIEKARHCVAIENEKVMVPVPMVRRILLEINGEKPGQVSGTMLSAQSQALLYGNAADAHVVPEDSRVPDRIAANRRQVIPSETQYTVDFSETQRISPDIKDVANLLSKHGEVPMRTFDAFIRSRPSLLYPLFGMSRQMSHTIVGPRFWQRLTKRRMRSRNRLHLPTAFADLLEKLARLDTADADDMEDTGDGYSSAGSVSSGEGGHMLSKPGKRALKKLGALDKRKYHKSSKKSKKGYHATAEAVLEAERENYRKSERRRIEKERAEADATQEEKMNEVLQRIQTKPALLVQEGAEAPILVRSALDKFKAKSKLRAALSAQGGVPREDGKWEPTAAEDGSIYYYHIETLETVWELPEGEYIALHGPEDALSRTGSGSGPGSRRSSGASSHRSREGSRRGSGASEHRFRRRKSVEDGKPKRMKRAATAPGSAERARRGSGDEDRFYRRPSYAESVGSDASGEGGAGERKEAPGSAGPGRLKAPASLPPLKMARVKRLGSLHGAIDNFDRFEPIGGGAALSPPAPGRTRTPSPFHGNAVSANMMRDLKLRLSPRTRSGTLLAKKAAVYGKTKKANPFLNRPAEVPK